MRAPNLNRPLPGGQLRWHVLFSVFVFFPVRLFIGAGPGVVLARTVSLPAARPQSKGRKGPPWFVTFESETPNPDDLNLKSQNESFSVSVRECQGLMSQGIEMCVQCAIMTQFIKYVTAVCHISHHNNKNPCSSQKGKRRQERRERRERRASTFHNPQSHTRLSSHNISLKDHTPLLESASSASQACANSLMRKRARA